MQMAAEGEILLMKGEGWNTVISPLNSRWFRGINLFQELNLVPYRRAAVHKSPQYSGKRVLLTMDPITRM